MSEMVKVMFYMGLGKNMPVIDALVQPEPPLHWVAANVNCQQRNIYDLFQMANLQPQAWVDFLREKFDFHVLNPTREGLIKAGVDESRVDYALETALEQAEAWETDTIDNAWSYDEALPQNLTAAQVYEVIAESRARGTPVIAFQAPADEVKEALSEDYQITLRSENGIYCGLLDEINGYGWSARCVTGPISFRPSTEGVVILSDAAWENVVDDAYTADISFIPGEPLRYTTKSNDTMTFGAPPVRGEWPSKGYGM